jgi:hypothetical protein
VDGTLRWSERETRSDGGIASLVAEELGRGKRVSARGERG